MARQPDSVFLNIGEVLVTDQPTTIGCRGLGSCVGLFVYDRVRKVAGAAHIFLPYKSQSVRDLPPTYSAEEAISEILSRMVLMGVDISCLRAKLIGGATIYSTGSGVGLQNVEKINQELLDRRIFIARREIGGVHPRTAHFNTANGKLNLIIHRKSENYV